MASAPSVTPDAIFQLAQGFMASKLFFTAGEIDLFAQLADGPKSQAELAAGLKLPPPSTVASSGDDDWSERRHLVRRQQATATGRAVLSSSVLRALNTVRSPTAGSSRSRARSRFPVGTP